MEYVLRTDALTKSFKGKAAVNKVSLNVKKGDIYGLIGRNGAGKTTLMKTVCGLISPTSGGYELFEGEHMNDLLRRVGCTIEMPSIFSNFTARENLIYYNKLLGISGKDNIDEILKLVGLADTGKKKSGRFSLGMKQRLAIGIALLGDPDLLVLDEPINSLDPTGIKDVRDLITRLVNERGMTVMISSHILGELSKLATRYGIIENGVLIEEFTAEELEERSHSGVSLKVDDTKKASVILSETLHEDEFTVLNDNNIRIYGHMDESALINTRLVTAGVNVSELTFCGQDLENYFIDIVGGAAK